MMRLRGAVTLLMLWGGIAAAQLPPPPPLIISPAAPTSNDYVLAGVQVIAGCQTSATTTITGTLIRIDLLYFDCIMGPPSFPTTRYFDVGQLPPGAYDVEAYTRGDEIEPPEFAGQQTFVVTAAATVGDVPALDTWSLGTLTVVIAAVALLAMSRQ
jgi:hypothetical protein